jgi:hypothetical protein
MGPIVLSLAISALAIYRDEFLGAGRRGSL